MALASAGAASPTALPPVPLLPPLPVLPPLPALPPLPGLPPVLALPPAPALPPLPALPPADPPPLPPEVSSPEHPASVPAATRIRGVKSPKILLMGRLPSVLKGPFASQQTSSSGITFNPIDAEGKRHCRIPIGRDRFLITAPKEGPLRACRVSVGVGKLRRM